MEVGPKIVQIVPDNNGTRLEFFTPSWYGTKGEKNSTRVLYWALMSTGEIRPLVLWKGAGLHFPDGESWQFVMS